MVGTWGGGLITRNGEQFHAEPGLSQISTPVLSMLEGKKGRTVDRHDKWDLPV